MLLAALCAFASAAVAGLFLALRHFTHKKLPATVALIHGLGGATGFTFVLLVVVQNPDFRLARQALYLFIVTMLLGAMNLLFHLRRKRHRSWLIVMHALVAVSGVLTLMFALFSGQPASAAQALATQAPAPSVAPSPAPAEVAAAKTPEPSASPVSSESAAVPEAPAATAKLTLDPVVARAFEKVLTFQTKSVTVSPESLPALAEIAAALKDHLEIALVEVQGHADQRGEESRNVALTQTRAAAVVEALVARGIDRTRLHSAGYGARCPVNASCAGTTAPDSCSRHESLAADRRVVFVPLRVGPSSFHGAVACEHGAELIPLADKPFHKP